MATKPQEVAKTTDLTAGPMSAMSAFAHRCGIKSGDAAIDLLKSSCFKDIKEDAQIFTAIVICNEYKLNPFLREIFILPTKGGLVPYVSIDGWNRIIAQQSQFNGETTEILEAPDREAFEKWLVETTKVKNPATVPFGMQTTMMRKDRDFPTLGPPEYFMDDYRKSNSKGGGGQITGPWDSTPARFLMHRSRIQCGRMTFGFYLCDKEEAELIRDAEYTEVEGTGNEAVRNLLASRKIVAPATEDEIPEAEREVLEEMIAGEEGAPSAQA